MIVLSITVLFRIIQIKNNIVNKRRDKPKITHRDNRKSITFFEKTIGFFGANPCCILKWGSRTAHSAELDEVRYRNFL